MKSYLELVQDEYPENEYYFIYDDISDPSKHGKPICHDGKFIDNHNGIGCGPYILENLPQGMENDNYIPVSSLDNTDANVKFHTALMDLQKEGKITNQDVTELFGDALEFKKQSDWQTVPMIWEQLVDWSNPAQQVMSNEFIGGYSDLKERLGND